MKEPRGGKGPYWASPDQLVEQARAKESENVPQSDPREASPHSLFGARTPESIGQESLWPLSCCSDWEPTHECMRETKCVG